LCQKWRVKLIFQGSCRLSGTGIVKCLKIIDVGRNLKQFDMEGDRKCIFHFRPQTKMLTKMKLLYRPKNEMCAYIMEIKYGSVANITFSAQRK